MPAGRAATLAGRESVRNSLSVPDTLRSHGRSARCRTPTAPRPPVARLRMTVRAGAGPSFATEVFRADIGEDLARPGGLKEPRPPPSASATAPGARWGSSACRTRLKIARGATRGEDDGTVPARRVGRGPSSFSELTVAEPTLGVGSEQSLDVGSGRRFHALTRLGCPVRVAIQHSSLRGKNPGG